MLPWSGNCGRLGSANFSQRGLKNINVDQVAAHAGVTKGSLYWHYLGIITDPGFTSNRFYRAVTPCPAQ